MATVTLQLDQSLLDEAKRVAADQRRTTDDILSEWLAEGAHRTERARSFDDAIARVSYAKVARTYNRDEMNER